MAQSTLETPNNVKESDMCVVCGNAGTENIAVQMPDSSLRVCASCGSWNWFPRVSASAQNAIHDNADYFEHPYFARRRLVTPALRRRCRDVFARLANLTDISLLHSRRFLDVGCDTGVFLKVAREEFGIVPVGIDVAGEPIQRARENGIEAYQTSIEKAPQELSAFAAASAIDLIEHVPDPATFLQAIATRLIPGGLLYIETPNIQSAVYRFGRLFFRLTGGKPDVLLRRLFPPQHVQYFTPASFRGLAEQAGLEVANFGLRALPASDIATSWPALLVIQLLQICDRILGSEILIWAVLRRPY